MNKQWNVLEERWIDAAALDGAWRVVSPLEALKQAARLRALAASSPLDEFAIHRFLVTLIYWKADAAGGLTAVREALLSGIVPPELLAAISAERGSFDLFDPKRPFLQDPAAADPKPTKPVGSLFAEIATGTNIAHFDHSRDMNSPLCVPCVVRGMLRLVPWSQQGGAGYSPAIHGAPPIAVIPKGVTLAETIRFSLVELSAPLGAPVWTGTFRRSSFDGKIPVLEALTWNPRRVRLPLPEFNGRCTLCGAHGPVVLGLAFKSNAAVRPDQPRNDDATPNRWSDPAFTYSEDSSRLIKSSSDAAAATATDIGIPLRAPDGTGSSSTFTVVVPCTNQAKTYDHRRIEVRVLSELQQSRPSHHGADSLELADEARPLSDAALGWPTTAVGPSVRVSIERFVSAALAALSDADWLLLRRALGRSMNADPEAFAVFSGVYWRVRSGGRSSFRRDGAWMLVKLMALSSSSQREAPSDGLLAPLLESLPRKQASRTRNEESREQPYPVAPPRGNALELVLASAVDAQLARGASIPWVELGAFLHNSSR